MEATNPQVLMPPTLQQQVEALPKSIQQIWGKIEYSEDRGLTIAECITNKDMPVKEVSDGSVHRSCTTHTWTLTTDNKNGEKIPGRGPVNGNLCTLSSYTELNCKVN